MLTWYTKVKTFHLPNDITMSTWKKPVSLKQAGENTILEDKKWLEDPSHSSGSLFHSKPREDLVSYATSPMFPIRRDYSKSPTTIQHLINVLIQAIEFLNPAQAAAVSFDQPFHPTAKRIQWNQPASCGKKSW